MTRLKIALMAGGDSPEREIALQSAAQIAPEIAEELHRMTRIAYKACRCSGVVRVDFIVTPEGKPYMIEINSIPGMSAGSIVPKQAKAMGMTLGEMFDLVIADTCRK